MARRSTPPELRLQVSFEVCRIAPQCLADAYERLVPIPRRSIRPMVPASIRRLQLTVVTQSPA